MKTPIVVGCTLLVSILLAASARAHFVWIVTVPDAQGKLTPHVCFGEGPSPGEEYLLDNVAQTKAWVQYPDKEPVLLRLKKQSGDETGSWVSDVDARDAVLFATCDYGVLDKGGKTFLLQYHAKKLGATPAHLKAFARTEQLPLDIVPSLSDKTCHVTVLWQGKPAVDSEVVIADSAGQKVALTIDDQGNGRFDAKGGETYAIRARFAVDRPGERDGKKYPSEVHYTTLTLALPGQDEQLSSRAAAADVLVAAREARALWTGFPGFRARVKIFAEGKEQTGTLTVAADGKVELTGLHLDDEKAALVPLRSLVSHRLSDTSRTEDVSFGDEPGAHPLGRLIKLDFDTLMASEYRVKDDVITEVNRTSNDGRFTITVMGVHRNSAGKYLPAHYNVSAWDKDGSLVSSTTVHDAWTRVGDWDLPQSHTSIRAGKNRHDVLRMEFGEHELLK